MTALPAGFVTLGEAGRLLRGGRDEVMRLADLGHLTRIRLADRRVVFRLGDVLALVAEDGRPA